ncbi:hypothetical protein LCGC14_0236370 [marine sediment metagenome]|uniref:Uncharacterized protein n=1 Tax=marine sediment metagenome TaxID=412755 RepID=A0A0F9UDR8_9ZZZZ
MIELLAFLAAYVVIVILTYVIFRDIFLRFGYEWTYRDRLNSLIFGIAVVGLPVAMLAWKDAWVKFKDKEQADD